MSFNKIAVYGHRGWASSAIVSSLVASGAPVKVLYRAGSDISGLPPTVTKVEVDVDDQDALIIALEGVDILISLVGQTGVTKQHAFVKAIPRTDIKLFSPSDLAARYDEQGLLIPVNKAKMDVEMAAKEAGIPTTIILPGNFAEFALNTLAMGVDFAGNKIVFSGNSAEEQLNLCTRAYVAAAYASIFTRTPISEIQNRAIALTEVTPTGNEIAAALQKKHGKPCQIVRHSIDKVEAEIEAGLSSGSLFTLVWYCRKIWGTGKQKAMVGNDIWEVDGYQKASLESLIVGGELGTYRELPPEVTAYFNTTF
ncbi:NmrA-like family protein (Rossmann-fold NAD(P)(+)-binding protein) [Pleurostoma richardsiae]|uniref:NmrA-like family protein (Rossmann-fold NAD(P)(+)-binding protein) n=1 Tax=Pleurostoma richardsiae TaxID=41990 RepID=A0AA38VS28_9PEZI|nr:NmrA-like family protein (Rossmann-fold NAD(P)(+)-binding protein) [Pleurostoma richardsiae]